MVIIFFAGIFQLEIFDYTFLEFHQPESISYFTVGELVLVSGFDMFEVPQV